MTPFEALMGELDAEREREQTLGGLPLDAIYTPPSDGFIHLWRGGAALATPWGVCAADETAEVTALVRPWLLGARWFEIGAAAMVAADSTDELDEPADEVILAQAVFDGLGERLGHPADTARAAFAVRVSTDDWRARRDAVARGLERVAAGAELQIVFVPDLELTLSQHIAAGTEIIESLRHPLELALSPAVLGADELGRLLPVAADGDAPPSALGAAPGLRFEDAVAAARSLAETAERDDVQFGLRLDGSALAMGSAPGDGGARVLPAVAELARRLSDRLRARVPMSVALPTAAVKLPELAAAGLLPVITPNDDRELAAAGLAALTDEVREHDAAGLADFACRRALATADGKPFRQRVREHAEANGGVCLRDRQWVAAWQAFEADAGQPAVAERVRRALVAADASPERAAEAAAQVGSACRRVNRASYADALRGR